MKHKYLWFSVSLGVFLLASLLSYFYLRWQNSVPAISQIGQSLKGEPERPLLKYSLSNLAEELETQAPAKESLQVLQQLNADDPEALVKIYQFSFLTQGKTMSGVINISQSSLDALSAEPAKKLPVIIMLRGYVPLATYSPGVGTKNAAAVFAQNGFVTIAPDFFGYGLSDAEFSDPWEARFAKVSEVADLINVVRSWPELTLQSAANQEESALSPMLDEQEEIEVTLNPKQIAIWAHSNGGQIAVSTLEVLQADIPASLWAPVLVPFPYSVLYFSDEEADEGKETRKFVALFEEIYDVFAFSLTQHLNLLQAPLQIQHGTADEAALPAWTSEFVAKVEQENQKRRSAQQSDPQKEISVDYYLYPGADHDLRGAWQTAVNRDLAFFHQQLGLD